MTGAIKGGGSRAAPIEELSNKCRSCHKSSQGCKVREGCKGQGCGHLCVHLQVSYRPESARDLPALPPPAGDEQQQQQQLQLQQQRQRQWQQRQQPQQQGQQPSTSNITAAPAHDLCVAELPRAKKSRVLDDEDCEEVYTTSSAPGIRNSNAPSGVWPLQHPKRRTLLTTGHRSGLPANSRRPRKPSGRLWRGNKKKTSRRWHFGGSRPDLVDVCRMDLLL